jgi:glucokinase
VNTVIGVDIGGTQIKAAAFSSEGETLHQLVAPTNDAPGSSPPQFAVHAKNLVEGLEALIGTRVKHVGISAPGLAARDGRSIAYMPGRMHGLERFDWSAWLQRENVPVLNDAHAALLGEVWRGAAAGMRDVILLTLGTGVGGAIWADGRLLQGHIGRAGHFGHLCLDPEGEPTITNMPGGLENWIGNHNILARSGGKFETTHDLVAAYENGDPFARAIWLHSVRALGCAIASLVNVLDPEAVVIGGGIARAGKSLFEPLSRVLDEVEWRPADARVRLLPAKLGEWAGAQGAAFAAGVARVSP